MKLPNVGRRETVRALRRAGFRIHRTHGDHYLMVRDGRHVSVPDGRHLQYGTLKQVLRQAEMSVEEFHKWLRD